LVRGWRTKDEYAILSLVVLRACKVSIRDFGDVEHTVDVTAETLYEAVASALAAMHQDNWVGEIAQGLNIVSVRVQQPSIKHEVKMQDFLAWLGRKGGSPAEIVLREKVTRLLGRQPSRTA
jgi:hypothetical protein